MDSAKITSLSNFVQIITDLNSKLERNGADKNEVLLFRGQEDKKFDLIPSIGRNRKSSVDISLLNEERNLIEMAILAKWWTYFHYYTNIRTIIMDQ